MATYIFKALIETRDECIHSGRVARNAINADCFEPVCFHHFHTKLDQQWNVLYNNYHQSEDAEKILSALPHIVFPEIQLPGLYFIFQIFGLEKMKKIQPRGVVFQSYPIVIPVQPG